MSTKTLAQQILDADDVETKEYPVPEWGVTLELRTPTGEERAALLESFIDMKATQETGQPQMRKLDRMYPALVIACAYDPDTGERVFEMGDATVAALNSKRGDVLERVALDCMALAGLTPDAVEEEKDGSSTSPNSENVSL